MSQWLWVSVPFGTFGIEVEDGKVIDAADVALWMIGQDIDFIQRWVEHVDGDMQWISLEEE